MTTCFLFTFCLQTVQSVYPLELAFVLRYVCVCVCISQFSCSVVSDSLRPHGPQHARLPCPSETPGAYSNLCPPCWWCHPAISSSGIPFSSRLQSFPASGSFPRSWFFVIRWPKYGSFSFSISPSNKYSGLISCRIAWLDLLAVQRTLKSLLQHHSLKASILQHSAFFIVPLSHPYTTTGKTIAFLPRSKRLLVSWLQSPSVVILELKKIKSLTVSIVSPSICHEVMGPDAMIFVFWMLSFMYTLT